MDRNNKVDNVSTSGNVKSTVDRLIKENFKHGKIPTSTIAALRKQYSDDEFIEKVQEEYYDKLEAVGRRAAKFSKFIDRKYGSQGYPLHVVLNKALKYKQKYSLSEPEFELFQTIYRRNMSLRNRNNSVEILIPETNMGKVFGDPSGTSKLTYNENEQRYLNEIIGFANEPQVRQLHSQVIVQSLTYDELNNPEIINSRYEPSTGMSRASYIDPVIAAMFLPKIQKFDEYFLFTNLAEIVKIKNAGESISTYVNYQLLFNLVTGQTDIVCDSSSPLKDIRNRVTLQLGLYQNVLNLRLGKFYDLPTAPVAFELRKQIDHCRLSVADSPDYIMFGDESITLRRLINALAFRSIIVATTPLPNINFGMTTTLGNSMPAVNVVKIPWITIRLPLDNDMRQQQALQKLNTNIFGVQMANQPFFQSQSIDYYLNSVDIAAVNGHMETRIQSVIHADDVIIFNIPRRTYQPLVNFQKIFEPTNFISLPKHAMGIENINTFRIEVTRYFDITTDRFNSERYHLRSAVSLVYKTNQLITSDQTQRSNIVIGTKTFLFCKSDKWISSYGNQAQVGTAPFNPSMNAKKDLESFTKVYDPAGVVLDTNNGYNTSFGVPAFMPPNPTMINNMFTPIRNLRKTSDILSNKQQIVKEADEVKHCATIIIYSKGKSKQPISNDDDEECNSKIWGAPVNNSHTTLLNNLVSFLAGFMAHPPVVLMSPIKVGIKTFLRTFVFDDKTTGIAKYTLTDDEYVKALFEFVATQMLDRTPATKFNDPVFNRLVAQWITNAGGVPLPTNATVLIQQRLISLYETARIITQPPPTVLLKDMVADPLLKALAAIYLFIHTLV